MARSHLAVKRVRESTAPADPAMQGPRESRGLKRDALKHFFQGETMACFVNF